MKAFSIVILGFAIAGNPSLRAQKPTSRPGSDFPTTATRTEELTDLAERSKGFGCVQTVHFSRWGRQVFAVWFCPFSGRGDCFLNVYYYNYEKSQWHRFIAQLVATQGDLSAEMPCVGEDIVFKDTNGKVVLKQSVARFPQKKWWDERK